MAAGDTEREQIWEDLVPAWVRGHKPMHAAQGTTDWETQVVTAHYAGVNGQPARIVPNRSTALR